MKTVPLNEEILYQKLELAPATEVGKLVGEVSVRLHELYDHDAMRCVVYLQKIMEIHKVSPESFSLALKILSGSGAEKESYSKLAKKRGTSRQYQHKQRQRELAKLAKDFPKVAEILSKSLWRQR